MVRVIDAEGEALGVIDTRDAIDRAIAAGLDLVEVAPTADPPVCRIMDFGKFKYEKAKKVKEAKKKQHIMHLKEIKFHPKTDTHDYNFKIKSLRKFLLKGDRVKVTVVFRGREIVYKDFGKTLLERVHTDLIDICNPELEFKLEGRNMISAYLPDKAKITAYNKTLSQAEKDANMDTTEEELALENQIEDEAEEQV